MVAPNCIYVQLRGFQNLDEMFINIVIHQPIPWKLTETFLRTNLSIVLWDRYYYFPLYNQEPEGLCKFPKKWLNENSDPSSVIVLLNHSFFKSPPHRHESWPCKNKLTQNVIWAPGFTGSVVSASDLNRLSLRFLTHKTGVKRPTLVGWL